MRGWIWLVAFLVVLAWLGGLAGCATDPKGEPKEIELPAVQYS